MICNLGRYWYPWEWWGVQAWAPRVYHSYICGLLLLQILLLDNSEVQGGYGFNQETLCVWYVCHTNRGSHQLWVPCTSGYAWILQPYLLEAVGTVYHQGEVARPTLTSEFTHCGHFVTKLSSKYHSFNTWQKKILIPLWPIESSKFANSENIIESNLTWL